MPALLFLGRKKGTGRPESYVLSYAFQGLKERDFSVKNLEGPGISLF
jgi:hypothetical protein